MLAVNEGGPQKMTRYDPNKEDTAIYKVVINQEEQYSIWPESKENPLGWRDVGKVGEKAACLSYIKEVWTDMRPLSLRKKREEIAKNPPPPPLPPLSKRPREKSLVDWLSEGDHPVEAGVRPGRTIKLFKEAIDHNYVHIKFTNAKGGTELGFRLDRDACDFSTADFEGRTGTVHVEGSLTLDYVKVRCIADVLLESLEGTGHLVKQETATRKEE
jgi:uncharacterized protein YbdZ (MbtH family)